MKSREYLLENIATLEPLELRTLNRCYLHPEDKRACFQCRKIITGIEANFRVKRKEGQRNHWVPACNGCSRSRNSSVLSTRRKDPVRFITSRVASYRTRAKSEGRPFNIDAEYLIKLWNEQAGKCFYTQQPIDFEFTVELRGSIHPFQPSLDKKDPALGYTKGNVVWCAYVVNRMKNDLDYDDFIAACSFVLDVHNSKP